MVEEVVHRTVPRVFSTPLRAAGPLVAPPPGPAALLILDLEGKEEVIEFPVIALDSATGRELGRFQRYVRPARLFDGLPINPDSPGIPFQEVLRDFDAWLRDAVGAGLDELGGAEGRAAVLTCGDWDFKHIHSQCRVSGVAAPALFARWVNVKRAWNAHHGHNVTGMRGMLGRLGLLRADGSVVHGFHHLGMHDVENIARCVLHLICQGADLRVNGRMK